MAVNKIFLEIRQTATGCFSRSIRERFDNHLCDYFPVGIREKSNHSVIALDRKQHILKVGEIELDESYFGARRVRGNDMKSSHIKREWGVAHTAKFPFPLNAGILDKHLGG